jgi:hypothetical protein
MLRGLRGLLRGLRGLRMLRGLLRGLLRGMLLLRRNNGSYLPRWLMLHSQRRRNEQREQRSPRG